MAEARAAEVGALIAQAERPDGSDETDNSELVVNEDSHCDKNEATESANL